MLNSGCKIFAKIINARIKTTTDAAVLQAQQGFGEAMYLLCNS
jgi:hypothetical protein